METNAKMPKPMRSATKTFLGIHLEKKSTNRVISAYIHGKKQMQQIIAIIIKLESIIVP